MLGDGGERRSNPNGPNSNRWLRSKKDTSIIHPINEVVRSLSSSTARENDTSTVQVSMESMSSLNLANDPQQSSGDETHYSGSSSGVSEGSIEVINVESYNEQVGFRPPPPQNSPMQTTTRASLPATNSQQLNQQSVPPTTSPYFPQVSSVSGIPRQNSETNREPIVNRDFDYNYNNMRSHMNSILLSHRRLGHRLAVLRNRSMPATYDPMWRYTHRMNVMIDNHMSRF